MGHPVAKCTPDFGALLYSDLYEFVYYSQEKYDNHPPPIICYSVLLVKSKYAGCALVYKALAENSEKILYQ